jgi:hypothetical protein
LIGVNICIELVHRIAKANTNIWVGEADNPSPAGMTKSTGIRAKEARRLIEYKAESQTIMETSLRNQQFSLLVRALTFPEARESLA